MNNSNQTPPEPAIERIRKSPWVCDITTHSRTTIWRLEKEGKFPKRRQIGNHAVGWIESEVLAWIAARPTVSAGDL